MVAFTMAGGLNDEVNRDLVRHVRSDLNPTVFADLPDVRTYVTGDAAFSVDVTQLYADGTPTVFVFVLGLSFLLMLVAFHSIVIPIKAIILNLLSTAAAYGVLVLVFQDGWFAGPLGITPSGVIESWVPLFIFTILFGLSMDYHLFILTRIKEARDRGLESRAAVAKGISVTAGIITSAASIMVVVFAVFVTLKFVFIQQLGLGLAVAVLIDATIIRSVLLPASMTLLGDWNWWMPRWLDWIPRVTIEGDPDEPVDRRRGPRPQPEVASASSLGARGARSTQRFVVIASGRRGRVRRSGLSKVRRSYPGRTTASGASTDQPAEARPALRGEPAPSRHRSGPSNADREASRPGRARRRRRIDSRPPARSAWPAEPDEVVPTIGAGARTAGSSAGPSRSRASIAYDGGSGRHVPATAIARSVPRSNAARNASSQRRSQAAHDAGRSASSVRPTMSADRRHVAPTAAA